VESTIELQPLQQRNAQLLREPLDLTAGGGSQDDTLPGIQQATDERQHRIRGSGPPAIADQVQNRQ